MPDTEKKENKNDKRKDRSADPIMRVLYSLLKDTDENHPLKKHELMENLDISRNACNNAVNMSAWTQHSL